MNTMQCKSRRTIGVFLGILVLYLLIRVRKYEHKVFVVLPKVHPNEAWEFVADFSNMKYLNPTITEFTITDESGNYEHWKYTAEYSEKLSHWPYLPNDAVAFFNINATPKKDIYYINSVHQTCLFSGLYCLESESQFKFTHSNSTKGALCEESVKYECPAFLALFCRREVIYQRNAIMTNLNKKFRGNMVQ